MKGTLYVSDAWYETKDIDVILPELLKDGVTLQALIENQEFTLEIYDTLQRMVKEGKLECRGGGTEEDKMFEALRKTIKYLKRKLALENISSKPQNEVTKQ